MKPCPGYCDPWSPVDDAVVPKVAVVPGVAVLPVLAVPGVAVPELAVPVVPVPVALVSPPDTMGLHPESTPSANAQVQRIVEIVAIVSPPGGG
jgi:hypothetical protein